MDFYSTVMVAVGSVSLVLALLLSIGSIVTIIAIAKNPLHLTHKPVDRITQVMIALFFLAGTIYLPFFGVSEILRGTNNTKGTESFPSFMFVVADFFIGSKLLLQLLLQIERFAAYSQPHFHRARFTKRRTTLLSVLLVAFSLLFSLLAFTGLSERIYHGVFIHLFASCSWLAFITVSWLTYQNLKNRRTRVIADEVNQVPQLREKTELERARNALGARKYLIQVAVMFFPVVLTILPWYIIKFIDSVCDISLASNARFFWQRFMVPLAFVTDVCFLLFIIFKEYINTIRFIFCNG